jgi:hypothetical protein
VRCSHCRILLIGGPRVGPCNHYTFLFKANVNISAAPGAHEADYATHISASGFRKIRLEEDALYSTGFGAARLAIAAAATPSFASTSEEWTLCSLWR